MGILRNKVDISDRPVGWDSPMVTCDLCGVQKQSHLMYNMSICMPVAGHHSIIDIGCSDHWACSIEHWRTIAMACIDEHIIPMHQSRKDKL